MVNWASISDEVAHELDAVAGARCQQSRSLGTERDVAGLVDDQKRQAPQPLELVVKPPGPLCGPEAIDSLVRGRERDPVSSPAGLDS
jgi:hypothetical protein